jgi:hypothetical protein
MLIESLSLVFIFAIGLDVIIPNLSVPSVGIGSLKLPVNKFESGFEDFFDGRDDCDNGL